MKYLIEIMPPIARANEIDANGGPGELFERIAARFKPEAMYATASKRALVLIADLSDEDMAELMFTCGRAVDCVPTLTPLLSPAAMIAALHRTDEVLRP